jgi:hypothetical protein
MMYLWVSYEKKNVKIFCFILKINEKKESDPDPLVRGADPGIRIRTKMSRIPNTDTFTSFLLDDGSIRIRPSD